MVEKCRVKPGKVEQPASRRFSPHDLAEVPVTFDTGQTRKWIKRRLVLIKEIVFREDAHAQFVERRTAQGCQRLLLELVALVRPGVTRRANLFIGRSIGIGEVMGVGDLHRPMIAWLGSHTAKCSLGAVECVEIASCAVMPASLCVWHKAN